MCAWLSPVHNTKSDMFFMFRSFFLDFDGWGLLSSLEQNFNPTLSNIKHNEKKGISYSLSSVSWVAAVEAFHIVYWIFFWLQDIWDWWALTTWRQIKLSSHSIKFSFPVKQMTTHRTMWTQTPVSICHCHASPFEHCRHDAWHCIKRVKYHPLRQRAVTAMGLILTMPAVCCRLTPKCQ